MHNNPLFAPPCLTTTDNKARWGELTPEAQALMLIQSTPSCAPLRLVITPDSYSAQRLLKALDAFDPDNPLNHLLFVDWETLPYDHFSPHQALVSERLALLNRLPSLKQAIVVAPMTSIAYRLPPKAHIMAHVCVWKIGMPLDSEQLQRQWVDAGYRKVSQVTCHGDFVVRGSIIDVFPAGALLPIRIELFDDTIDSLRQFDPKTQCSKQQINQFELLPAHEYGLCEKSIAHFRKSWRTLFSGNPMDAPIYRNISNQQAAGGAEYFLPLFFEHLNTVFDYLPLDTLIFHQQGVYEAAQSFWETLSQRYDQLSHDIQRPICSPSTIALKPDELFQRLNDFKHVQLSEEKQRHHNFCSLPPQLPEIIDPLKRLHAFLEAYTGRVIFCSYSLGQHTRLQEQLTQLLPDAPLMDRFSDFLQRDSRYAYWIAPIDQGFCCEQLCLLTQADIYRVTPQSPKKKTDRSDAETIIYHLGQLQSGDLVVHHNHGIGRFLGLDTLTTDGIQGDYLALEYANQDKIYVPCHALDLIGKYLGGNPDTTQLQKLGSKQWEKSQNKAKRLVEDTAAKLLEIYKTRAQATGYAFSCPGSDSMAFAASFPFETTPDQQAAIEAVEADMQSNRCMDRLVCGDVGFGKTEVAMRAAFLAAHNNKQVAVLVPTTLLAHQHTQSFQERFAAWPISIGELSRIATAKEKKSLIAKLASGHMDIVIGTHALLNDALQFKDLGLLIIDEEHRFGVKHKEKIKSLKAHVDILTLTATPIPRTLSLSLSGIRDISMITTPPMKRLPIKTMAQTFNEAIVKDGIMREIMRGGQVFYLHNRVRTINKKAELLQSMLPNLRVGIAHGQMHQDELEHIMVDFHQQKFQLLLCTTIIESGIDIPNANTIIVDHAESFGLAQLHQMRGRVGRSHHQAYAYLMHAPIEALRSDAKKRLAAIAQMDSLGSGFQLANHDLEIRGAGSILGDAQSGQIEGVGYVYFMQMLDEALKQKKTPHDEPIKIIKVDINLYASALLSPEHMVDVSVRLDYYKQIAHATTQSTLHDIRSEVIDRFGKLPEASQRFFRQSFLSLQAAQYGINKITAQKTFAYIKFEQNEATPYQKIIALIQQKSQMYQLKNQDTLRIKLTSHDFDAKIKQIEQLFKALD